MMLDALQAAWSRSDALFALLRDEAWLERPIPLRQPFVFYLGHLPAFAWNHLGGLFGRASFRPEWDALFARGIDPLDPAEVDARASWPEHEAVVAYREAVRHELTRALASADADAETEAVVAMVIEHESMHHETLLYMVQELDHGAKRRPADWPALPDPGRGAVPRRVEVPAGEALTGANPAERAFGWDNEFPERRQWVSAFAIDDRPATNERWLEFVGDGGYLDRRLWREEDWDWRKRRSLFRPHSWRTDAAARECAPEAIRVRSLFQDVAFEQAAHWPVMVSWAEAAAFARWRGARLPTEAEWQRAAYGSPSGEPRAWPWGDAPLTPSHANAGFANGSPVPSATCREGASAWGIHDLVGNGWEWTSSVFAPQPGFQPMARYPGYSADFFDGCHFVLLGGSWATEERLLRRSFRNWFQPHYPFVFSKLRCVHASGTVSGV